MRKIIALAAFLIALAGCGKQGNAKWEKLCNTPFNASVELMWCDEKYSGSMKREDNSSIELSLTSDKLTSEITYSIKDEGLTVKMEGLEFSMPYQKAPSESLVIILYESLMLLPQAEISGDKNAAALSLPKAEITYDNNFDKPVKIKMTDGELSFTSFEYL